MRNNPLDWRINNLKTIAVKVDLSYQQPRAGYVIFRSQSDHKLNMPAKKAIELIYVKLFIE